MSNTLKKRMEQKEGAIPKEAYIFPVSKRERDFVEDSEKARADPKNRAANMIDRLNHSVNKLTNPNTAKRYEDVLDVAEAMRKPKKTVRFKKPAPKGQWIEAKPEAPKPKPKPTPEEKWIEAKPKR